jgi:hypothetical protein
MSSQGSSDHPNYLNQHGPLDVLILNVNFLAARSRAMAFTPARQYNGCEIDSDDALRSLI